MELDDYEPIAPPLTYEQDLLGCLVGDMSEGLLWCSYNDDEILNLWLSGRLNNQVEQKKTDYVEYQRFLDLVGEPNLAEIRELQGQADIDWEAILTYLYHKVGGWPQGWLSEFTPLEDLPPDRYGWVATSNGLAWPLTAPELPHDSTDKA